MTNLITHIDKCLLKWIWFNTNDIVVYSFLAWLITQSLTMHSVHLPFQCSKVYRLHDLKIQDKSLDFKLGTIDNRKDYLQIWGEFFFSIFIFFVDINRNTGFSSRHLLRLQKFCMNSRFRTGIFWIHWYRFDFAFTNVY